MFELNSSFVDHILAIGRLVQANLLKALFDLLLGILIVRFMVRGLRLLLKLTHIQTGLRYVLTSIIETVLWMLLTVVILQELGFQNLILFFTGSIAAIGIAMAAGGSTLVSDVIAAVFLARDHDFNVGDEVIVGETPTQGVIERMDARRIRVRDDDGILHVIPNSLVERKEWVVLQRRAELSAAARAARTAKRLGAAALEKRSNFRAKAKTARENEQ
ncbi:MAG TPA: mechanosensitive ion channel domain-containing protein [Candidatus Saccharimonadia bacterium]|nr:mechanosensitive ion channel domain-containing protein [Candidatus Saccharimonadia bacterium]